MWPYNASSTIPPSKDTFVVPLPFASSTNDPIPIGAFTSQSATKEPGLVVVTPGKGKIAYWETLSSASSLVPGPQAHGVQGSVPGMLGGETITGIVNAEPAGFILTFSHGRVAHLTLKDQLGRPAIGIQFLRKVPTGSQAGIFGSIRNVFGGSGRKGIAAVHPGKASRGQRDVIVVTEDAEIELWDTRLNVGNALKYQLNVKQAILDSLVSALPTDGTSQYQFAVLDFAFSFRGNGQQISRTDDIPTEQLLLLVTLNHQDHSTYYIIEAEVSSQSANITCLHPVTCYRKKVSSEACLQTRLVVPQPGQTAFIVFESAIVVYSLARLEDSPSSQLLLEGGAAPAPFQDCIRFQEDTPFRILASEKEDRSTDHKNPSVVLSVQSFGLVRVSSTLNQEPSEDDEETKVTAKSKIEQAVFFGTLKNNPLDLSNPGEQEFNLKEVESAALEISVEILTSASKYLPKASASVDQHLRLRAKAHEDLALYVNKYYGPLSRYSKFELLGNGEKLAVLRAMWKVNEEHLKRRPAKEETILQLMLFYMHERHKTVLDRSKGENDRIRKWMTCDGDKVQWGLAWLYGVHSELYKDEVTEPKPIAENILETIDHFIASFDAAYEYREDNAALYGLGDETFNQGMLTEGYAGIPLPWTSELYEFNRDFVKMTVEFAQKWWVAESANTTEKPNPATVRRIGATLPKQTAIFSRAILDRARWFKAKDDEAESHLGDMLFAEQRRNTRKCLLTIAGLGFSNDAVALAEKFWDMDLLVELNIDAIVQLSEQSGAQTNEREAEKFEREAEKVNERMDSYFDRYHDKWARAYYERLIQDGQLGSLLNDDKNQEYLTRFLRNNPAYGKLTWINEIVGQKGFSKASDTLALVAKEQEADLWSKKVELCLSKLTQLAAIESQNKTKGKRIQPNETQVAFLTNTTSDISLIDLQTRLHVHVTSLIGRNVLDVSSQHQLAFEILGKEPAAVAGKPAFKGLLYDGLGALLRKESMTVDQLVDVLTLMNPIGTDSKQQEKITEETIDAGVAGNEDYFALKAVEFAFPNETMHHDGNGASKQVKREALQKIVWRRVMLRDNWQELNKTNDKNEKAVVDSMRGTFLWATAMQVLEEDLLRPSVVASGVVPSNDPSKHIPTPKQILESNLFPTVLQSRFAANEVELVRKDLNMENEALKKAIETARLDVWFPGLLSEVRTEILDGGDIGAGVRSLLFDDTESAEPIKNARDIQPKVRFEDQAKDDVEMNDQDGTANTGNAPVANGVEEGDSTAQVEPGPTAKENRPAQQRRSSRRSVRVKE